MKCLSSFARNCTDDYEVLLLDDGTVDSPLLEEYIALFRARLRFLSDTDQNNIVRTELRCYPNCLAFWEQHVLARKLLAVPLVNDGQVVFIDSDILFVRPFTLVDALSSIGSAYGFMLDTSDYARTLIWPHTWRMQLRVPSLKFVRRANTGMLVFNRLSWSPTFIEGILRVGFYRKHVESLRGSLLYWMQEQSIYAMLGASCGAYYFNPTQCRLANEGFVPSQTRSYVALHFVSGTRHTIEECLQQASICDDAMPTRVTVVPAERQPILMPDLEEVKLGVRRLFHGLGSSRNLPPADINDAVQ
jgi:hypothetical protein